MTRYVNLMRWWIRDVAKSRTSQAATSSTTFTVNSKDGIPASLSKEISSGGGQRDVPPHYAEMFRVFADHLEHEMNFVEDETLQKVRYPPLNSSNI